MNNSQKILKMISAFIEAGILTSQDLKKELLTSFKFKKENFEEIKLMKIEHLNKKIYCVKNSNNFKEMKKCWGRKKKY